jgi:hypothetical protein
MTTIVATPDWQWSGAIGFNVPGVTNADAQISRIHFDIDCCDATSNLR